MGVKLTTKITAELQKAIVLSASIHLYYGILLEKPSSLATNQGKLEILVAQVPVLSPDLTLIEDRVYTVDFWFASASARSTEELNL